MKILNIKKEISKAKADPKVSIKRTCLFDNKKISFHVAEIKKHVQAHVHKRGDEVYTILKGRGLIYFGKVNFNKNKIKSIRWEKPKKVEEGDVFNIPERFAHHLKTQVAKNLL